MRLNKKFLLTNILNEQTQKDNTDATKGIDELLNILGDNNYSGSYYDTSAQLIHLYEDDNSYTIYLYSDVKETEYDTSTTKNTAYDLRRESKKNNYTEITPSSYNNKIYFENAPFKYFTGILNTFTLDISDNKASSSLVVDSFNFFSLIPSEKYMIVNTNNKFISPSTEMKDTLLDKLKKLRKVIIKNAELNTKEIKAIQTKIIKNNEVNKANVKYNQELSIEKQNGLTKEEQKEFNQILENENNRAKFHFNDTLTADDDLGEFTSEDENKIKTKEIIRINPALLIRNTKPYTLEGVYNRCKETSNDLLSGIKKLNPIISTSFNITLEMIEDHQSSSKHSINYSLLQNEFKASPYDDAIHTNLRVYPPEILAPMAFLTQSCKYNGASENAIKQALIKIFGNGNSSDFEQGEIIFPMSQSNGLVDSYIQFKNGRQIGISSKAGTDGKGAAASTKSLLSPLFDMNKVKISKSNYISPSMIDVLIESNDSTQFCKDLLKEYNEELTILLSFALNTPKNHKRVFDELQSLYGIENFTTKNLSSSNMSKLIMKILDSLSYNFAQINTETTPVVIKNNVATVTMTHTVQYPAVFNGTAQLEVGKISDYKVVRFHIV